MRIALLLLLLSPLGCAHAYQDDMDMRRYETLNAIEQARQARPTNYSTDTASTPKQIDGACMNECLGKGSSPYFCQSKCSF